ncbi:putative transmembrane protein [Gregarina niphandrodes]|uniref:Transmembrane protein n=1 Tax=Gregarina niphandrodes TaxID=110365 RepID=A0A023B2M9_GRENI|nr:putative transmembrane protein [Gregarina niphandrodes]EZG50654.1 putative transmembrane protein [Gregarina niphandrodes]|eukprot:XP_011131999.1 putative transmembrane protein [Gregarina niphandrodes]
MPREVSFRVKTAPANPATPMVAKFESSRPHPGLTLLPHWLRYLYSILVIAMSAVDIAFVIMPGEIFYAVMRIVFTLFLHPLEPRTEIGIGILADIVYGVVYIVWGFTKPIELNSAITYLKERQLTLCIVTACLHFGVAVIGLCFRFYDGYLLRQRKKHNARLYQAYDMTQI